MSIAPGIYARLAAYSGLTALVSTRIYPLMLPLTPTYPAVTYNQVSASTPSAMGVDMNVVSARVQVSSWARTFDEADAVATQVRAALKRYSGTIGGVVICDIFALSRVDLHDSPANSAGGVFHVAQDFEIYHEE